MSFGPFHGSLASSHLRSMAGIKVHDIRRQRTTLATVLFLAAAFGILWWAQIDGDPAYRQAG
jgi:hypothetical protein